MAGCALTAALLGRVPARRLRLGAADEPRGYALQLARWHFAWTWRAPDGGGCARALANGRVPSLSVWSAGDPLARGRDVRAVSDRLGVTTEPLRLEGLDHFGILRDPRTRRGINRGVPGSPGT